MNDSAGQVLAGRYRFIRALPSSGGVITAWRAMDLVFGDDVAVYSLAQDPRRAEGASREFRAAFVSACRVPRAGMISWHAVNVESGLAVREWVHGFTLQDLLRRRRKISLSEALSLLGDVPQDLDHLLECGITPPGDLLQEIWVAFDSKATVSDLLGSLPSRWPRHHTRLTIMRVRDFWQGKGDVSLAHTLLPESDPKPIWIRLARLVWELLGGRIRNDEWIPLPALKERANDLLRDTFDGKEWNSASHFWREFEASAVEKAPRSEDISFAPKPHAISSVSGFQPTPCRSAALIPEGTTDFPIHLCAGTEFRFGRSRKTTEFPTIRLPRTPEDEKLATQVGRVHVRLEARDGALWLRDGNGEAASANGTQWEGAALPGNTPVELGGRGMLNLADQYEVALRPVASALSVVMAGPWKMEPSPCAAWCAVIPTPMKGLQFVYRSVWILTALAFNIDEDGDIQWQQSGIFEPWGVFLRVVDGFYLGNIAFPSGGLRVDGEEVLKGEAIPLVGGQRLQIGGRRYRVSMGD